VRLLLFSIGATLVMPSLVSSLSPPETGTKTTGSPALAIRRARDSRVTGVAVEKDNSDVNVKQTLSCIVAVGYP
jgi:hypothetical protein